VACEVDEETEAAAAPARTTVRAVIRMASFIDIFSWMEVGIALQNRKSCY
jgi:hypothetical protein